MLVLTALLLGGCISRSGPGGRDPNYNPNAGRYSMDNDSPELERIDLSSIPPVVPVVETRTAAGNKSPYTINGRTYFIRGTEEGYVANGYASWYGRKFHGHQTSNGEIYDMFKLTAAHKTLPIPSYVRVTNLENERSVIVRINDRGPFHDDRIIDLSYAAATMLDYAGKGTARVRVEAVMPDSAAPQPGSLYVQVENPYTGTPAQAVSDATWAPAAISAESLPEAVPQTNTQTITQSDTQTNTQALPETTRQQDAAADGEYLQVGAFSSEDSATGLMARLAGITSLPARIHSEVQAGTGVLLHRVRLGPLDDSVNVETLISAIRDANLGNPFRVGH